MKLHQITLRIAGISIDLIPWYHKYETQDFIIQVPGVKKVQYNYGFLIFNLMILYKENERVN